MVTIDFSDFGRWATELEARAHQLETNPFGSHRPQVEETLKKALEQALDMGKIRQTQQNLEYAASGQGRYGSHPRGDQSLINPQEKLDPAVVQQTKDRLGIPGPHHSLLGSSYMEVEGSTFKLKTKAEMTPYPNKRTGYTEGPKPIMYYLEHGWVDRDNPNHKMNPRDFKPHVAKALMNFIFPTLYNWLMLSAGFHGVTRTA